VRARWANVVAVAAVALVAAPAAARGAPSAQCRAEQAGERAWVAVTLDDLLEPQLLRLVALGLPGRLRVEVSLYRRRSLWFDALVAQDTRVLALAWSRPEGGLLLEGRRAPDPARLELAPSTLRPRSGPPLGAGHYVTVNVRLEVVTADSLGEVARWLVAPQDRGAVRREGEAGGGASNAGVLPRVLVNYLAADLARTARARCPLAAPP
jgi:hypothetical protein